MTELICLTTLKNKIKIVRYIESNKDKTERQKERKKIKKRHKKKKNKNNNNKDDVRAEKGKLKPQLIY